MEIKVLDHGFVRFVESWGGGDAYRKQLIDDNECGIVEAARQSTQGSFRGWDKDERLLKYLYENKHSTPFEFAGMVIEVKAPMFVFREWHRHRTQSYNEMSARYAPLPNENYIPTLDRLMMNSKENKQAGSMKGSRALTEAEAKVFQSYLGSTYSSFETFYQASLRAGVPKELARCGMPVGRYSQMRATANLRNWIAFLTLRMAPEAQWEIRQYANAVGEIIKKQFPKTWSLFRDGN